MKRTISLILAAVLILGSALGLCGCEDKTCSLCGCEKHLPTVCQTCGCTKSFSDGCDFANTRSLAGRKIRYVKMSVRDYGDIIILLDATTAPKTVKNFLKLVNKGFYNGLTFHRIMKGFMIQGGCPEGNGSGSTKSIKGEFYANGYNNDLPHIRGVISMARRADSYNSGSCQFFICNADARSSLDYQYASFGYVLSGMSVVDEITNTCYPLTNPYYSYTITNKSLQPIIDEIVELSEAEALALCD